jgi:hypothetical protein
MGIDDFVGSEAFSPTVKLPTYTPAANADGIPFDAGGDFGPVSNEVINTNFEGAGLNTTVESSLNPQQGLVGDTLDYLGKRLDPSPEAAMERAVGRYEDALKFENDALIANDQAPLNVTESNALYKKMVIDPGPEGILSRYTPALAATAATGLGIAAAAGAFTEEEAAFNAKPNKSEIETTAYDKWREVSDKNSPEAQGYFNTWNGPAYVTRSQYEKQTGGPSIWQDWRFLPEGSGSSPRIAAMPEGPFFEEEVGSDAQGPFPGYKIGQLRAMGGEVVGPGTGTSDSIPARLSDGEFVMTANAVQNAGGGNRDLGAARMYDMMRRFEGGVA